MPVVLDEMVEHERLVVLVQQDELVDQVVLPMLDDSLDRVRGLSLLRHFPS